MELLTTENLFALLSLTALEIVLGFDNIVIMSVLVSKLDKEKQAVARRTGIFLAMLMRILLLLSISWIMMLTNPLFSVLGKDFSGKSLILIFGGMFLIAKATFEIHDNMEEPEHAHEDAAKKKRSTKFWVVIGQIVLLDLVFSLDSVITAVGMAQAIEVMIFAILVSVALMMLFAKAIGDFIHTHPTFKILALSFLVLVGVMLVSEGLGQHVEKGYVYFAMCFSLMVEFINQRIRSKGTRTKKAKAATA